jgi:TonB family protein
MRTRIAVICLVVFSCCFGAAGAGQNEPTPNEGSRKVLRRVNPAYPVIAKQMGLAGRVRVIAVVAPDGSVKKVEPVGGSPLLVQAAASAISQWKYAPGAESRESVELHFNP